MRQKRSQTFIILLLLAGAAWWAWQLAGDGTRGLASAPSAEVATRAVGPVSAALCGPDGKPLAPAPADSALGRFLYPMRPKGSVTELPAAAVLDQLGRADSGGSNETAYDDVQSVSLLLDEYVRAFGAMPTGEQNDEIVKQMQGENPRGLAVLPKQHAAISAEGELLDRWGTPYRFHPESAWTVTVRSAGPDRKMWTTDDVLMTSSDGAEVSDGLREISMIR